MFTFVYVVDLNKNSNPGLNKVIMQTNENVRDGYAKNSPENEKDESKTKTNHSGDLLLPPAEAEKMLFANSVKAVFSLLMF